MVRVSRGESPAGDRRLTDILAGHGGDPRLLAEVYDLEHDERREDLVFYREFARRARGAVLDLGAGSGRLLRPLVEGASGRVVALDGSPALLDRARRRIQRDPLLRAAHAAGRLEVRLADVRSFGLAERFGLIAAVDVLPHLGGDEEALRMLTAARRRLTPRGRLIVDLAGPAALPDADMPLGEDWDREANGTLVRRTSELRHAHEQRATTVLLSTITELRRADGTIARLPAAFRLWYPDIALLEQLVARAGLGVSSIYGSHELDAFDDQSDRLIVVSERPGRQRFD